MIDLRKVGGALKAIVAAACVSGVFGCNFEMFFPPLDVVEQVDLSRFVGTWYEVARYPNGFEEGCAGVTAEYAIRDSQSITVKNTCIEGTLDGPTRTIEGYATIADPQTNSKLNVVFFPPFGAPYWILELSPDYEWAVIGEPSRSFFWILSRTPTLDQAILDGIISRMPEKGYDPSRLIYTPQ
ncbi:MAG: lipocalin family protein [Phycisphaerae bacterium]|nr:lipocalin family protein [Phycisphaerae bacterium]